MSKPQRRTLIKTLRNLVDRVNGDIFAAMGEQQIMSTYKPLLRAVNDAEIVLDREHQHEVAMVRKENSEKGTF